MRVITISLFALSLLFLSAYGNGKWVRTGCKIEPSCPYPDNKILSETLLDGQIQYSSLKCVWESPKFRNVRLCTHKKIALIDPVDIASLQSNVQCSMLLLNETFAWQGNDPAPSDYAWRWAANGPLYLLTGHVFTPLNSRFHAKSSVSADIGIIVPDRSGSKRQETRKTEYKETPDKSLFDYSNLSYIDTGSLNTAQINGYTDKTGPYHRVSMMNDIQAKTEGVVNCGDAYSEIVVKFSIPGTL